MRRLLIALALAGSALAAPVIEERVEYAGSRFRVVRIAPEQVRIVWKDEQGLPYRTFAKVQTAFAGQGKTVTFLMNAGIFQTRGTPCGLHIEKGMTLHDLNLADAPGNFFLKPNGVLWIQAGETGRNAFIAPSEEFPKHTLSIETAVQSGPLLLINGRRHPAFKEGSPNKLVRNGAGVDSKGRVVFAVTEAGSDVNLWDFAGLFLKLDCRNALFLDGDISQISVNPGKPAASNQFGAMFVVTG